MENIIPEEYNNNTRSSRKSTNSGSNNSSSFAVNVSSSSPIVPLFIVPPETILEPDKNLRQNQQTVLRSLRLKNWIAQNKNAVMIFSIILILVCIALAGVGAVYISDFVDHTTEMLVPPAGTLAHKANTAFEQAMPFQSSELSYFNVFVQEGKEYFFCEEFFLNRKWEHD